jgi:hypothetical protein
MAKFELALFVLISAGLAVSASARTPIYRCTENDQTILTDLVGEAGATLAERLLCNDSGCFMGGDAANARTARRR